MNSPNTRRIRCWPWLFQDLSEAWKSSIWCPSFPSISQKWNQGPKTWHKSASFQSGRGGPGREFRFPESQVSAFLFTFITGLLRKAPRLLSNPEYWEGTTLLFLISFRCTLMYNFSVFLPTSRCIQKPWLSPWLLRSTLPATAPITAFVTEGQLKGREEN